MTNDIQSTDVDIEAVVHLLPEIARTARGPRGGFGRQLGVPQIRALLLLANEDFMTMGELARRMGLSCAAATQAVDQLVDLELAQRERPDWDRRVVLARLTERARPAVERAIARRTGQVREVFARLNDDERKAFAKGLRLLAEVLLRDYDDTAARVPQVERTGVRA